MPALRRRRRKNQKFMVRVRELAEQIKVPAAQRTNSHRLFSDSTDACDTNMHTHIHTNTHTWVYTYTGGLPGFLATNLAKKWWAIYSSVTRPPGNKADGNRHITPISRGNKVRSGEMAQTAVLALRAWWPAGYLDPSTCRSKEAMSHSCPLVSRNTMAWTLPTYITVDSFCYFASAYFETGSHYIDTAGLKLHV